MKNLNYDYDTEMGLDEQGREYEEQNENEEEAVRAAYEDGEQARAERFAEGLYDK